MNIIESAIKSAKNLFSPLQLPPIEKPTEAYDPASEKTYEDMLSRAMNLVDETNLNDLMYDNSIQELIEYGVSDQYQWTIHPGAFYRLSEYLTEQKSLGNPVQLSDLAKTNRKIIEEIVEANSEIYESKLREIAKEWKRSQA